MKRLFPFYTLAFIFLILSCNDDDIAVRDFDQVITINESAYWDVKNPTTYYLDNSIRWLQNPDGGGNSNPEITRTFDIAILNSIEENMNSLNYTRVEDLDTDNLPDLIIKAQALVTSSTQVNLIWDAWYNWYGIYNPLYPGGTSPVYYNWSEGSIFIEMGDATSLNEAEETIDIVWGAGINGLVKTSQAGNISYIEDQINTAFNQSSSYLIN